MRGAKGHAAGRQAFLAGASELEIHYAFVEAVESLEFELAFPSIVALNEKGATLHYENKRSFRNGQTLLLDCGARTLGYASDITRTTPAAGCDARFKALVAGMEKNQLELGAAVRPQMPFGDLHHLSHLKLATLLKEHGILDADPDRPWSRASPAPSIPMAWATIWASRCTTWPASWPVPMAAPPRPPPCTPPCAPPGPSSRAM